MTDVHVCMIRTGDYILKWKSAAFDVEQLNFANYLILRNLNPQVFGSRIGKEPDFLLRFIFNPGYQLKVFFYKPAIIIGKHHSNGVWFIE